MNLAEGLAREIMRVTVIRAEYESLRGKPQIIVEPQIAMMTASLENACKQAGMPEGIEGMMAAMQDLKEYER